VNRIAISEFLNPVSQERPLGIDITDDPLWISIAEERMRAAQMTVRFLARNASGDWNAEDPIDAWKRVRTLTQAALLERSKDIRLALWWTEASARLEGFGDLLEGLQLTRALLETFAGKLHPQDDDAADIAAGWLEGKLLSILSSSATVEERSRSQETRQAIKEEIACINAIAPGQYVGHVQDVLSRMDSGVKEHEKLGQSENPVPENATSSELPVVDVFLKIEDIPGESKSEYYPAWIDVYSFSHRLGPEETRSGESGKIEAVHGDIEISKPLDRSSPKLYEACCARKYFKVVMLEACRMVRDRSEHFLRVELEDAFVRSVVLTAGTAKTAQPSETVRFAYRRIRWTFTKYEGEEALAGSISSSWDLDLPASSRSMNAS